MDQLNDILCREEFTVKQWLTYYKNVWTRNAVARTIDVFTDEARVKADPKGLVDTGANDGSQMKVIQRLEQRKQHVADALEIVKAVEGLQALSEDQLAARWSVEALKLDESLKPREYRIIKEGGLQLPSGQTFPKDTILKLDPTEDAIPGYVADGALEEVKKEEPKSEPAEEAATV